ncbi:hypothetical protein V6N12_050985 [Hibiscus sabdariffa]|uniref:Uncharacterized protein n=1 Tax=Hibiscus sabdariffa TaxID=183260 RepID=A0ABR2GE52_9ROSI
MVSRLWDNDSCCYREPQEEIDVEGIGTLGRMGGKALTDVVFLLWFSTVIVSIDVVHRLGVENVGLAASPPVEVNIAGAALSGNFQKPPKVWIYYRDNIVLGLFVIFLAA